MLEAAEEALDAGVRALVVISAGFAEIGREGIERQEKLLALVREHGARLVGPNCLGIASSPVHLNATFAPRSFPTGKIAFSSQSGALGLALLEASESAGLGVTAFVSIGNKADVSSNDLLEWWEDDDETEMVILYLESFGNPRAFNRIAQRLARRKPILALKGGTTRAGSRAAGSHTAALAGSDAAADALFRDAGVIRARHARRAHRRRARSSPRSRCRAGGASRSSRTPAGSGSSRPTRARRPGSSCRLRARRRRLRSPTLMPSEGSLANPIDMLGGANAESFEHVLPPVLADPAFDAVIVLYVPTVGADEEEVGAAISRAAATADGKPVLCSFLSAKGAPAGLQSAEKVPSFAYPEAAAKALGRAVERGEWLRRPAGTLPELDRDREAAEAVLREALADSDDAWLDATQTRRLLEAYGVPLVAERVVPTPDAAVEAAARDRLPGRPQDRGRRRAQDRAGRRDPRPRRRGRGARRGRADRRARCSCSRSSAAEPSSSPAPSRTRCSARSSRSARAACFAELIGEAQFRLAPLTDVDAQELVRSGKAGRLVAGFRGAPPADEAALVDLLLRLSLLAEELPEVAELDLNPVLALPDRCVAVDARIRVAHPAQPHRAKSGSPTTTAPREGAVRGGCAGLLRPVAPSFAQWRRASSPRSSRIVDSP